MSTVLSSLSQGSTLADVPRGGHARITRLSGEPHLAGRLHALGLKPHTDATVVRRGLFGGPVIVEIAGTELLVRRAQARLVEVDDLVESVTGTRPGEAGR